MPGASAEASRAVRSTTSPTGGPRSARREAIGYALASGLSASLPLVSIIAAGRSDAAEWAAFSDRFISDGRVIDTGNKRISHSMGQGAAMVAAATFGTVGEFDRLWSWTYHALRRPYDYLHSWRFIPDVRAPVTDVNNATDGDILIAYGLLLAALRWNVPRYRTDALRILSCIRSALVRGIAGGVYLLPGAEGFDFRAATTLNPSYYIFPALRRFQHEDPDPIWTRIIDDGQNLCGEARFGRRRLPADWVSASNADGALAPARNWPDRFSYDAVRIPLYLCWAGYASHPAVIATHEFWRGYASRPAPAWVDLETDGVANFAQNRGMLAIRRYVAATLDPGSGEPDIPSIASAEDYYAAKLTLLTRVALHPAGALTS